MNDIPPKLQNQIAQFQALQQQLQSVLSQKFRMESQLREVQMTEDELNKSPENVTIYRNVGSLLIKANDKEGVFRDATGAEMTRRWTELRKEDFEAMALRAASNEKAHLAIGWYALFCGMTNSALRESQYLRSRGAMPRRPPRWSLMSRRARWAALGSTATH